MATRSYARPADQPILAEQLQHALDVTLARVGTKITVGSTTIDVTHPALVAGDDTAIQAILSAYVYDPLWNARAELINLRDTVPALRTWSTDADTSASSLGTAITNWVSSGTYTAAKDTVIKQTLQGLQTLTTRLGRLCDRIADVIATQGLN